MISLIAQRKPVLFLVSKDFGVKKQNLFAVSVMI